MSRTRPRWRRPPSDLVIERRQLGFALGIWVLSLLLALGLGYGLGRAGGGRAEPALAAPDPGAEPPPAEPKPAVEESKPAAEESKPAPVDAGPAPSAAPTSKPDEPALTARTAGGAPDTGEPSDVGEATAPPASPDAGAPDAGAPDAGVSPDAGEAPAAAAPALRVSEALPSSGFGLQLGSFPTRAEAVAFLARNAALLSARPNYIQAVRVRGKGQWFRVRHGRWKDARAASAQLKRLPKALAKGSILVEYR